MNGRIRIALLLLAFLAGASVVRAGSAFAAHAKAAATTARERASLVRFARRYLGVRYVYGGVSPGTGFDCSGFTRFVYAHFGVVLPHASSLQFAHGQRVSRGALRPGDLVFFDGLGHVGLYIGSGRFIHAPHTGLRVEIDRLAGWYSSRYDGARRFF